MQQLRELTVAYLV